MTSVPPEPRRDADVPQTLADWFQLKSRYLAIGAATVAAAALGYWFYTENAERRAAAAERELGNARRTMMAGNPQLAQADLKRVVDRHGATRAGVEAALLLAESYYTAGKYAEGIDVLKDYATRGAAEAFRTKVYSLIGDGRMQQQKPAEAAADYQRAAEAARFEGERYHQLAKRARALGAAGDTASARKLWEELEGTDASLGISGEARVRLGELQAAVAGRS